MTTKMIRVDVSDSEWLTKFAGELQAARASRVSLAEAISILIGEHRESERKVKVADEDVPQEVLEKLWEASVKIAEQEEKPTHLVYGQKVANWQRYR